MKKVFITLCCFSMSVIAAKAQNTDQAKQMQMQHMAQTSNPTPAPAPGVKMQAPAPPADNPNAGSFKFKEETYDFKEVPEGPQAECDFDFTNVGKEPIIISEAHGSCGCTVPKYSKDPVLPGKKGTIHVTYNTSGRVGPINKDVFITSNAKQSPMKLHITGTVKPKAQEPATKS